jgi:hypothetical protein
MAVSCLAYYFALKMAAICSSETSVGLYLLDRGHRVAFKSNRLHRCGVSGVSAALHFSAGVATGHCRSGRWEGQEARKARPAGTGVRYPGGLRRREWTDGLQRQWPSRSGATTDTCTRSSPCTWACSASATCIWAPSPDRCFGPHHRHQTGQYRTHSLLLCSSCMSKFA